MSTTQWLVYAFIIAVYFIYLRVFCYFEENYGKPSLLSCILFAATTFIFSLIVLWPLNYV